LAKAVLVLFAFIYVKLTEFLGNYVKYDIWGIEFEAIIYCLIHQAELEKKLQLFSCVC